MDGIDEGGDMSTPVISTEGDRARREDAREDGEGESSGAGGGGNMNRKVRDAIWICDLPQMNTMYILCKETARLPLAQRHLTALARPGSIYPGTVAPEYDQNRSLFFILVFDLRV